MIICVVEQEQPFPKSENWYLPKLSKGFNFTIHTLQNGNSESVQKKLPSLPFSSKIFGKLTYPKSRDLDRCPCNK